MDVLQNTFLMIFNMSITSSYVIIAVLLVRLCIRKIPKIFSYALWSGVAFRLLCPVSFASMISIFNINLFNMTVAQQNGAKTLTFVPTDIAFMKNPKVTVGISVVNSYINGSLLATVPMTSINPMQIIIFISTIVWCFGISILLINCLVGYIKVKRTVSSAVLLENNIYECDRIPSPFVLGLYKPKIYIPFRMDKRELEYILYHEKYHIKRLDYIVKPIAYLILTIYWFNPLVWIAFTLMCKDMEMSCDEKVLTDLGIVVKTDYSMSLLSLSAKPSLPFSTPLMFGEVNVKARIKNVLQFKKPKFWLIIAGIILCIGVIIACTANPRNGGNIWNRLFNSMDKDEISDMYGYYAFDHNIYTVPYSSFMPIKGQMPNYKITENSLQIIDDTTSSVQEIEGTFKKVPVNMEELKSLFEIEIFIPDFTSYKECYQYGSFSIDDNQEYRLYVMDSEIWLVNMVKDYIRSIYRLVKTENHSDNLDGSTNMNSSSNMNSSDTEEIDKLLSEIISSPSLASATGAYISAHQEEYDTIVSMGIDALSYLIEILDSGDRGLRGNIVRLLCEDIIENINNTEISTNDKKLIQKASTSIDNWNAMMGY